MAVVLGFGRMVRAYVALAAAALLAGGVALIVYAQGDDPSFGAGTSRWEWGGTSGRPILGVAMALTAVAVLLVLAAWRHASRLLLRVAVLVAAAAAIAQVIAGFALSIGH